MPTHLPTGMCSSQTQMAPNILVKSGRAIRYFQNYTDRVPTLINLTYRSSLTGSLVTCKTGGQRVYGIGVRRGSSFLGSGWT